MKTNIIVETDSYKIGHYNMMPENTEVVYSYFESRNGAKYPYTVFFSLQAILKEYLVGQVVTKEKIDEAEMIVNGHLGPGVFNRKGWEYILEKHDGRLPVRIKAVQEGLPVPTSNVLMTVENTDPKCYWLTNYLETLLTHVWYGSTVATKSRFTKEMLAGFLAETSDNPQAINFMLHDFGCRGVSSSEGAMMGGMAHIINFMGTDTIPALVGAMKYYGATEVPAYSVPASEHSVMTSEGEDGEFNVVERLLNKYPTGILSVVIDSYDYQKFIDTCGTKYKDIILAREGKLVFRPDSGSPVQVSLDVIQRLEKYFGCSVNSKGFKVLNPKVGVLWGDGVDAAGIFDILNVIKTHDYSAENMVFGMGGALLQKVNRDTQRFAFKSSYQVEDGVPKNIYKNPLDQSKRSKKGRLMLVVDTNGNFNTIEEIVKGQDESGLLELVFENGELKRDMLFAQVRKNAQL